MTISDYEQVVRVTHSFREFPVHDVGRLELSGVVGPSQLFPTQSSRRADFECSTGPEIDVMVSHRRGFLAALGDDV
jgi:hypothetical protein